MPRRGEILVLGLGRFGGALAETLVALGYDVLGVDADERIVQEYAGRLTHVVQADTTSEAAMRQIGAADFGAAVVAIGTELEASVLTTALLVDLGIKRIVARCACKVRSYGCGQRARRRARVSPSFPRNGNARDCSST